MLNSKIRNSILNLVLTFLLDSKYDNLPLSDKIPKKDVSTTSLDNVEVAFTDETKLFEAIRERATKLNLSTELLNALESHQQTARNSDGDASSDVTSFLTSLLGSFLPVFDSTSINADSADKKTSITSGRPYKIVEVENPDQIVPLEVKTGYSQVHVIEMTNEPHLPTNGIFTY